MWLWTLYSFRMLTIPLHGAKSSHHSLVFLWNDGCFVVKSSLNPAGVCVCVSHCLSCLPPRRARAWTTSTGACGAAPWRAWTKGTRPRCRSASTPAARRASTSPTTRTRTSRRRRRGRAPAARASSPAPAWYVSFLPSLPPCLASLPSCLASLPGFLSFHASFPSFLAAFLASFSSFITWLPFLPCLLSFLASLPGFLIFLPCLLAWLPSLFSFHASLPHCLASFLSFLPCLLAWLPSLPSLPGFLPFLIIYLFYCLLFIYFRLTVQKVQNIKYNKILTKSR